MRALTLFAFLLTLIAVTGTRAHAEEKTYRYEVYGGGIHAVTATMKLDLGKSDYTASLTAVTRGFLGKLAPWEGTYFTEGHMKGDKLVPEQHIGRSLWRGEGEAKTYSFDKNGQFQSLKIVENGKPKKKDPPSPKLTNDTTDLLSATLAVMMEAAKTGECKGESDVFDGSRRFTLHFKSLGTEVLEKSRYAPFAGKAMKCTVEITPKGGKWHEKPRGWMSIQEQGRAKGTLPTVWLAKAPGAADTDPAFPVRIRVKTNYGTLFMHLTQTL
jgi:hypothetical protein